MNLVLIGYRGSGKTSVGRRLAERMGWTFVDADAIIEQRAGRSIREIFAEEGEKSFRDRESAVIEEYARHRRLVFSVGGGAVLRDGNVTALKASGRLIWLSAPAELLWERIREDAMRRTSRPRRNDSNSAGDLRGLLKTREGVYARVADWTVDVSDSTVDGIASAIEAWAAAEGLADLG